MAHKYYSYKYAIDVPPYDRLPAVLEAFFTSYPDGDYSAEAKEQYKLEFRRGNWKRTISSFGMLVPGELTKARFNLWPITVRLLLRPSPETFHIAVQYRIHLPSSMKHLPPEAQTSVDAYVRKELGELAKYLAECIEDLNEPPEIVEQ